MLSISKFTFAATFACLSSVAWAGEWIADSNSGCKVWNPYPQINEQISWTGNCVEGYAEGHGVVKWAANGIYFERDEGRYKAGKPANVLKVSNPQGQEVYYRIFASGEELIPREIYDLFIKADAGDELAKKTIDTLYSNGKPDVKRNLNPNK